MEDICVEMTLDQLRTRSKLSLTCNLDSAVWGVGTEGIHLEKAGGVVYLHRCAKMEVTIVKNGFCTDAPVRLGQRHGAKVYEPYHKSLLSKLYVD